MVNTWSLGESTYMRISSTITGFSATRSDVAQQRARDELGDHLQRRAPPCAAGTREV